MGRVSQIRTVRAVAFATILAASASAVAQVLEVATLNTEQIRALDRQKTAVILVGGILEEHGPYLPSYTDGYANERLARNLAEAVAARPGWTALLFPPIPLGSGGANEIGRKYAFSGSFTVRASTLRSIFMDLGDELGDLGFRWVFVVHGHGSPPHNHALDQAARYFQETHGGRMVHLLGGMGGSQAPAWRKLVSPEALAEDGFSVHAGLREHSAMLFLRPDLVSPALRDARSVQTDGFKDLEPAARAADWPGYFGAPRHASSAVGASTQREGSAEIIAEVLRILDGIETPAVPRYADAVIGSPEIRGIVVDATAHDARRENRQRAWIEKQAAWPPPVATPSP
jgi:creatinine amidohydrolase/Fe(II)-dependent formamide hydrolase-like protein